MKKRVVIVDDVKMMREKLKDIFQELGFEVVGEALDGDSAVNLYLQHRPDLITMDVIMPNKNGIDAAKEILEKDPGAKIIIVTTLGQEDFIFESMRVGVADFVVKPFTARDIKRVVKRIFR